MRVGRLDFAIQRVFAAVVALAVPLLVHDVHAQGAFELRHDVTADAAIAIGAFATSVGLELAKPALAPSCLACGRSEDGADAVNGLDRAVRSSLVWEDRQPANIASYVTGFGTSSMIAFGITGAAANDSGTPKFFPVDSLLIFEATSLATLTTQATKLIVRRERPFVHALPSDRKLNTSDPGDNNVSFFSGHTSVAFALAASSGTVAEMRGYRLAPLIWGMGAASGLVTGYLRIAADKHYFSDVLVGALVGTAFGVGVPLVFHGRGAFDSGTTLPSASTAQPIQIMSFGSSF